MYAYITANDPNDDNLPQLLDAAVLVRLELALLLLRQRQCLLGQQLLVQAVVEAVRKIREGGLRDGEWKI